MEQKFLLVLQATLFTWLLITVAASDQSVDDGTVKTENFCDAEECAEMTELTRSSRECTFLGHHPRQKCTINHVMLDKQAKTFKTYKSPDREQLYTTWNIMDTTEPFKCDRNIKRGFVFLIYYYLGQSNYYHLHYDTLIPLYFQIRDYMVEGELSSDVLLMPSVETSRLKVCVCVHAFVCLHLSWLIQSKCSTVDL